MANYHGRLRLLEKADDPFKMGYDPELDISLELELHAASNFQTIISVLRWMIKLRRIDILTKMSLLPSYVALPREGHLDAAVYVMAHVGQRYNSRLLYDSSHPKIDHSVFKKYDWLEFNQDSEEGIPVYAPEPQGKKVNICIFMDANHAADKVHADQEVTS